MDRKEVRDAFAVKWIFLGRSRLVAGSVRPAQEAKDAKVYKHALTPEQTEELLKKLGIEFKKTDPKKGGTMFYDYQAERASTSASTTSTART